MIFTKISLFFVVPLRNSILSIRIILQKFGLFFYEFVKNMELFVIFTKMEIDFFLRPLYNKYIRIKGSGRFRRDPQDKSCGSYVFTERLLFFPIAEKLSFSSHFPKHSNFLPFL